MSPSKKLLIHHPTKTQKNTIQQMVLSPGAKDAKTLEITHRTNVRETLKLGLNSPPQKKHVPTAPKPLRPVTLTPPDRARSEIEQATSRLQKAFRWNDNLIRTVIPAHRQPATEVTWDELANLSWQQFEDWVPLQLSHIGFDCAITKKAGDGGSDTIAAWPHRPEIHLVVSCKHYLSRNTIGARDIQIIIGACAIWDAKIAAVITTGYFSPAAIKQVSLSSSYRIFLVNRESILTPKSWFKNSKN